MRTTLSMLGSQTVFNLKRSFNHMSKVRVQLSSGRRINSFADDPRGVGSVQRYNTILQRNEQYVRNVGSAKTFLESIDGGLQGIAAEVTNLRLMVLQQLGPIADRDAQATAAIEAARLRDGILNLANQKVEGEFLFGGFRIDRQPFVLENGTVSYAGDDGVQRVQVSPSLQLDATLPGSALMGGSLSILNGAADLLPELTGATLLSDIGLGSGFSGGEIEITDGQGDSVQVDLSGAFTVQNVIDTVNAATAAAVPPVDVTVRISDDGRGLTADGTGPMAIGEVGTGSAARDLGLIGSTAANSMDGTDIRAPLRDTTSFADVGALSGGLPLGTLRFRIGGGDIDVDLSAANSVLDIRNTIQSLIPDMDVQISGGALSLTYDRPEAFELLSPPGDSTADLLGLSGGASPSRLFGVFEDVIAALQAGDETALRQTLIEIEDIHDHLMDLEIDVGSRQTIADQTENLLRNREVSLQLQKGRVEDIELIDAATRLSFAETAYQAALASTARVFDLSLVNYL